MRLVTARLIRPNLYKLAWLIFVSQLGAAVQILPTPHFFKPLSINVTVPHGGDCVIVVGPASMRLNSKMRLAGDELRQEIQKHDPSLHISVPREEETAHGIQIHLWNYAADSRPATALNALDRELLSGGAHAGQGYVLTTPDAKNVWIIGSGDQGVLWGAMTLMQLVLPHQQTVAISGAYIRDFPDFEFRAAADWLLNGEVNRWALDRGQGIDAYIQLCKRKLSEALRYKINFVMFDGFGWGLKERFPRYAEMMRTLNQYARERGIHLEFGGYGASYGMAYQTGPLYEDGEYLGKVYKNREWYPDGPVYRCMGFPGGRKGVDPATLGSCRSNDDLNRLKAEELRRYVEAIEPGALYIHHKDFGGFDGTQKVWTQRCPRCRARWPNDSLAAPDGGAGGLATGYSALINAINSVKNPKTGYDASRDCQIILVSPVYAPDSPSSQDWSNVVELWREIGKKLPRANNVQVCFREIFPQKYGGQKWADAFNSAIHKAGLNLGIFWFVVGGADNYATDAAFAGTPAMNALFQGSCSMYNFSGNIYNEPMQIANAEYDWNINSTGFYRNPLANKEATDMWNRFMFHEGEPAELYAAGGIFHTACRRLYGPTAGPFMFEYYQLSAEVPDVPLTSNAYLPRMWNRVHAAPSHWRDLALDSKSWGAEITNESYQHRVENLKLTRKELHRRLAHRWEIEDRLSKKGADLVERALGSQPLRQSIPDLQFIQTSLLIDQPLMESLEEFHNALSLHFSGGSRVAFQTKLEDALSNARRAQGLAAQSFPHPIDPIGAEVGSLNQYADRLVSSIETWLNTARKESN